MHLAFTRTAPIRLLWGSKTRLDYISRLRLGGRPVLRRIVYTINAERFQICPSPISKLKQKSLEPFTFGKTLGKGFVVAPKNVENYDINLTSKEGIDYVDSLLAKYEGFESKEKLLYMLGINQAAIICDRNLIPFGVTARLYIINGKLELFLCNTKYMTKRTGRTLDDAVAISDAQESTIYHPNLELPGISEDIAASYSRAFIAGMKKVFFSSNNLHNRGLFSTLIHVYFGRA